MNTHVYIRACMYICIFVYMYMYACAWMYLCIYVLEKNYKEKKNIVIAYMILR